MRSPRQAERDGPSGGVVHGDGGTSAPALSDPLAVVRTALASGAACLAFQPVVQAQAPHAPAFHEGLMRLQDASGRVIPAGAFIDAIEDHPLGREVDMLALGMGLRALRTTPSLRLAINMSARSVTHGPWREVLRTGLAGDPTVGERLILEMTEASAMDCPEVVVAFMRDVQATGVAFALDDFGAGATAFRYLRSFRFDAVKIDGQFIRDLPGNGDGRVLVSALVDIARHFEMLTVAEKVETEAEASACARLGVQCLQGYRFGAPVMRPEWGCDARLSA